MKVYIFEYKTGKGPRRIAVIEESLEKALYFLNHVKKLNLEYVIYQREVEVEKYLK